MGPSLGTFTFHNHQNYDKMLIKSGFCILMNDFLLEEIFLLRKTEVLNQLMMTLKDFEEHHSRGASVLSWGLMKIMDSFKRKSRSMSLEHKHTVICTNNSEKLCQ